VVEAGLGTALATPKFIFLPVLVLLIGAGYWEKVIYGLSDGIIIMILSASAAAYTVGENERILARSYKMSRVQFFSKVFVPSALLPVIEALRISMVLVISGVMLAEMYISNAGMGFLIFQAGTQDEVPLLIGAILVVAALAVVLNSAFQLIEKSIGRWRT
jgi:NitT/TauT family transport system permease protein